MWALLIRFFAFALVRRRAVCGNREITCGGQVGEHVTVARWLVSLTEPK